MILDMPLDDWDAVMATHLRGSFLMLRAVEHTADSPARHVRTAWRTAP